jgi:ADP-heptose:LPS heptosyltransferase
LTNAEHEKAAATIREGAKSNKPFMAFSLGTKFQTNEYGDENWRAVLSSLGQKYRTLSLVCIGAESEFERSAVVSQDWPEGAINLCGKLRVRESASVLSRAQLFIGHDSGPMHLASAVGTPCVSIFSGRNLPGIWFPHGEGNITLYNEVSCQGCGLVECLAEGKRCILSIPLESVIEACTTVLAKKRIHCDESSGHSD